MFLVQHGIVLLEETLAATLRMRQSILSISTWVRYELLLFPHSFNVAQFIYLGCNFALQVRIIPLIRNVFCTALPPTLDLCYIMYYEIHLLRTYCYTK